MDDIEKLQDILGHSFTDEDLIRQALRHASSTEDRARSNERLEFLGDRVLGLVIAETLFGQFPLEEEGALARRFAGLTSREGIVRIADKINLMQFVHTQSLDTETKNRSHASVVADTMEAVLGALYLDGGLDIVAAFIQREWEGLIDEDIRPPKDAKTALQEWAQGQGFGLPNYEVMSRTGPDHAPTFKIRVSVPDYDPQHGEGTSRRNAEQDAAQNFLTALENNS